MEAVMSEENEGKEYSTLKELVEENGITRDELLGEYSDMYKERHGIRPRWNYGMTSEQFIVEMEALADEYREEVKREEEDKKAHADAVAKAYSHTEFTLGDLVAF
jgi:nucleotide-binding universal stress UspA family protein